MNLNEESKFNKYQKELLEFLNQGEDLNVEIFESWKENIAKELKGVYKVRFNRLQFYSMYYVNEDESNNLPF